MADIIENIVYTNFRDSFLKSKTSKFNTTQYMAFFEDTIRSVDLVLVYDVSKLNDRSLDKLEKYFHNIVNLGLALESTKFSANQNIIFIKVHAPDEVVYDYSRVFDFNVACRDFPYRPGVKPPARILACPLTRPDPDDPEFSELFPRAPESVSGVIPSKVTSAEKITIIFQLLCRVKYSDDRNDFGFDKLIKENVLLDCFPLHDGSYKWTDTGPLNDRQLLARYWGNFKCWYKTQPVNLIEVYYGTEYALYFAWLGFYIQMLLPLALLSILVLIYGLLTLRSPLNYDSPQICHSDKIMCPKCHFTRCKAELFKNSCWHSYLTYMFDNPTSIIFAIIVSLWSTVFMELFQRYQSVLQLQWNVDVMGQDFILRPEFLQSAEQKHNILTDQMEPYVSKTREISGYIITTVSIFLLLLVMVLATIGVMVYRVTITLILMREAKEEIIVKNTDIIASLTGATMSAIFIFVFKWIYARIALVLTNMERHRTQHEYDNSYVFKSYALAFTNNYAAALYIAFFKGKFYTHPGDMSLWTFAGGLGSDRCDPTGCILDLSVLLIIILVFKAIASNISQVVIPLLVGLFKRTSKHVHNKNIPQWEIDYLMAPSEKFFIVHEYMDMVIQYGFVTFFVVAFPLSPLLAFISNIFELRVDASKVTKSYRRPVPNRIVGLGAWFGILQAMTYVGLATNGFIIAFTSQFVSKEVYKLTVDYSLKDFQNTTISVFDMEHFHYFRNSKIPAKVCYYPGKRYPPGHPSQYELTGEFYSDLVTKLIVVLVYEHVLGICKGFLAYAIPDIPFYVKQEINKTAHDEKMLRLKYLSEQYEKVKKTTQTPLKI